MTIYVLERLQLLNKLIYRKDTGTPKELARKLHISEKSARNQIELLKGLGATIHYSRKLKTYYYGEEGYFRFGFNKADNITVYNNSPS